MGTPSQLAVEVWADCRKALERFLARFELSEAQVADVIGHCGLVASRIDNGELPQDVDLRDRMNRGAQASRSTIRAYLYTSAKNEALRSLRLAAGESPFDLEGQRMEASAGEPRSMTTDGRLLRDYLLELRPRDRLVIVERSYGESWESVAEIAACSVSTAQRIYKEHYPKMQDLLDEVAPDVA